MVYLDYAANTPVDKRVLKEFLKATKKYIANPNSTHKLGVLAKAEIDKTSEYIASYFNADKKSIIYTSGSSESNNLVIKGIAQSNKGKKIIISAVEHSSIVAPCNYLASLGYDIVVIPLKKSGLIDIDFLKKEIDNNTILVSICAVDSELGTIQPIKEIAKIVKKYPKAVFHTDATQAIGKANIDYTGVDFITFAPHKFFGLNGFGVLLNINNIKLTPLIHGGKSTTIYRSGTPVTANVVALKEAFMLATSNYEKRNKHIKELNNILRKELASNPQVHINSPINAIANTLNISLINKDKKDVIQRLEEKGFYLSTTTACSLGNSPSTSVLAITKDKKLAENTIRISISHLTSKKDIKKFLKIYKQILKSS